MAEYLSHPLDNQWPPEWAWGYGEDREGVFVEIKLGKEVQRMRWIFPGTFQMGSPEGELGRYEREGPRHEVTLTKGFWLADTPCTQALWESVMGENPSRFRSSTRPVEQVSWEDCHQFFKAAEALEPGLNLRLPTEAEWEYACRAGTETATWLGDLGILGARNAPILDSIAWYGGNSGVAFDLENGFDSSKWEETQYPQEVAGTRKVKGKLRNPWGLYDMLGNVWEWCSDRVDHSIPHYPGASRVDPQGPESGTGRVIRGGSWSGPARYVRAAYRSWYHPEYRGGILGFRLSRGPDEPGTGRSR